MGWKTPFEHQYQLNADLDALDVLHPLPSIDLPGHPRIKLNDTRALCNFLESELHLKDLETIAPRLWMMSMQSSANISPLHRQIVKGRAIIVAEDPRLHLVWTHDRIHLKPLPTYLLSHAFWEVILLSGTSPLGGKRDCTLKAALGYIRTYYYLIKHESDFSIALEKRLVPPTTTWREFCDFSAAFDSIADAEVSHRYAFGELRLRRLNFYSKIFLRKWAFHRVHSQYGAYFSRFYAPFLFLFGTLSVILSALQLEMSVEALASAKWKSAWLASRWISVLTLLLVALISFIFLFLFSYMFVKEWKYAIRDRIQKTKGSRVRKGKV